MPFDGSGFDRWPPVPEPPKLHSRQENVLTGLAIGFVLLMMVLPISASVLIDLARYVAG